MRFRALDGLRGLALLGMMAWHAQVSWVQGGFARMTIFFVLAGFLSTRSLLRVRNSGQPRPFLSFWGRRARRLLPVTVLGVLTAIGVTAWIGGLTARQDALGDAASVLASVSNWRFIADERPYGAMFETPNAFTHFWSLSVEEQCFLLLPLFLWLAMSVTRRRGGTGPAWALLAIGAALSAIPAFVLHAPDTAYFATHVRAGEFLVGAALAWWWSTLPEVSSTRWNRAWGVAGATGLALLAVVMLTLDRDASWIYRGGMGLFSLPAAAVIGAIMVGAPIVTAVLGVTPLAVLGRWAFSIYALHWPIFLVVEDRLAGQSRHIVVVVEFVVAIAVGGIVYHLVERPLQPGAANPVARAWSQRRVMAPAVALGIELCLVMALLIPSVPPEIDFTAAPVDVSEVLDGQAERNVDADADAGADAAARAQREGEGAVSVSMTTEQAQFILDAQDAEKLPIPVFRDSTRIGVAFFGGSTALTTALGGDALVALRSDVQPVPGYTPLGCGVLDQGVHRDRSASRELLPDGPPAPECRQATERWAATARLYDIDVAVVPASRADFVEWDIDGSGRWRAIGDPILDRLVATRLAALAAALEEGGAQQILLFTPVRANPRLPPAERQQRVEQAAVYRHLLDEVVAGASGTTRIQVVDLYAWSLGLDDETYLRLFPDGVHPSSAGAQRIWVELLGPMIPQTPTGLTTGGALESELQPSGG